MNSPTVYKPIPKQRVTLQQIADQAGVACSTVSKALRNSPELPVTTRNQLQELAREMGYSPDPAMTKLMQHLRHIRHKKHVEPLAFVSYYSKDDYLKTKSFNDYLNGAVERSRQLGYQIQYFWMGDIEWNHKRLSSILRARGIQGVLLSPSPLLNTDFEIDWREFATVSFGYSLRTPPGHRVTNHQYHTMLRILQRLDEYGYRKIGFVFPDGSIGESRINNNFSAALYVYQNHIPKPNRVPPIRSFPITPELLIPYVKRWKPDALISTDFGDIEILQTNGFRIPEDIGMAFISIHESDSFHAGIDQKSKVIGASAVDLISQQLYENQLGIPPHRKVVLIEGTWVDGKTVLIPETKNPSLDWNLFLNP